LRFWVVNTQNLGEQDNGVRDVSLWQGLLGVDHTVIDRVEFDDDERCWWRMCVRTVGGGADTAGGRGLRYLRVVPAPLVGAGRGRGRHLACYLNREKYVDYWCD